MPPNDTGSNLTPSKTADPPRKGASQNRSHSNARVLARQPQLSASHVSSSSSTVSANQHSPASTLLPPSLAPPASSPSAPPGCGASPDAFQPRFPTLSEICTAQWTTLLRIPPDFATSGTRYFWTALCLSSRGLRSVRCPFFSCAQKPFWQLSDVAVGSEWRQ